MSENKNGLAGMKCPKCGNMKEFFISGVVKIDVVDELEQVFSTEWRMDAPTYCTACKYHNDLRMFLER